MAPGGDTDRLAAATTSPMESQGGDGMPETDAKRHEVWIAKLAGRGVDAKVDALRQISWQESVTGLTAAVILLAGDRDEEVRMWSAEVLETSIQPDPSEVGTLVEVLETSVGPEVGYWAATMLGRLGESAVAATGALEACLREAAYPPSRERAAWALGQLGPQACSAIPALQRAAQTGPPRLQRIATAAIRSIVGHEANAKSEGTEGDVAA